MVRLILTFVLFIEKSPLFKIKTDRDSHGKSVNVYFDVSSDKFLTFLSFSYEVAHKMPR